MNIRKIANRINDLSISRRDKFSELQAIRTKNRRKRSRSSRPFAGFGIKKNYAFHSGGRGEFQFNIGEDFLNDKEVFRYGLAFSLRQDQTIRDFRATFQFQINRFNECIKSSCQFLDKFVMWYAKKDVGLQGYFNNVGKIDDRMFESGNFIFLGNYFSKTINDVTDQDIDEIERTFNYLMPFYQFVQFGIKANEKRISRLCWNENDWIMPSGPSGKSSHEDSHESKHGFGHEEWLFDTGKLIKGYHYGFLEPIRKQQEAFVNNKYDVWLYTIDGETKKRFWIGEIHDLEVIDEITADKVKDSYVRKQWLNEMEEQIKAAGADAEGFLDANGINVFNVRFLPKDLYINDPCFVLPRSHPVYNQSRYAFVFYEEDYLKESSEEDTYSNDAQSNHEDQDVGNEMKTYFRQPKVIEIPYIHKTICRKLTAHLKNKYGSNHIDREHRAGFGSARIDIFQNYRGEVTFYEVKTYNSLRASIRDAFGQLMEYSSWPNKRKADRLVIVTQPHSEKELQKARIYFKHLRKTYRVPIYYQYYDYENDVLGDMC